MKPSKLIGWLFVPATGLMSRMWYWQKFVVLTIFFTIPVGFALFSFFTRINSNVTFTEREIAAIQYVSPVLSFLQHVQQHRGVASLYLRGESSFQELLGVKEREILEDITRIDAEDKEGRTAFQLSGDWNVLKEKWLTLQRTYTGLIPIESFNQHTALTSDILIFIHKLSGQSGIVLDPETASYETVNAIVNIIPGLTENMGQTRAFGTSIKDPQKISDMEQRTFINYAKISEIENAKLQNNMRNLIESIPSLKGELEMPAKEIDNQIKSLNVLIEGIISSKKIAVSLPEYYAFMAHIIDTQYLFATRLIGILNGLLENRIVRLNEETRKGVGITVISYLLILYLFAGFYILVARTVRTFEDIAAQLVSGKTAVIPTLSRDELGEAGKSFNIVGQELIRSNNEILHKARDLQEKSDEFERMNQFMINREVKMSELKDEIARLKKS